MNPLGHPIFSLLFLLLEYCFNFDLTRVLVEIMGSENLQVLNKRIVIKKKRIQERIFLMRNSYISIWEMICIYVVNNKEEGKMTPGHDSYLSSILMRVQRCIKIAIRRIDERTFREANTMKLIRIFNNTVMIGRKWTGYLPSH